MVAILSMPPPPRGPVPARIMRRTSSGACSATIWATPPPSENPKQIDLVNPRARMNAIASVPICSTVVGTDPPVAPTPRLSKAMTRWCAATPSMIAWVPVVEDRGQVVQEHHRDTVGAAPSSR